MTGYRLHLSVDVDVETEEEAQVILSALEETAGQHDASLEHSEIEDLGSR